RPRRGRTRFCSMPSAGGCGGCGWPRMRGPSSGCASRWRSAQGGVASFSPTPGWTRRAVAPACRRFSCSTSSNPSPGNATTSRPSRTFPAGERFRSIRRHPRRAPGRSTRVNGSLAARGAPEPLLRQLPGARRGLEAIRARERTDVLTPYDGLLGRGVDLGEVPLAPTALEGYAACPFRFLLERVYRLQAVEEPDRI